MAYGHIVLTTCILFQYFDVQAVVVKPSVFVRSGSSAELTCTYDTHASEGFTLEWRYATPGTPAAQAKRVLYYNGKLYWVNSRKGRMALVQNPPVPGVASVRIINAQISDAGLYICVVTNPNDWSSSGQGLINLTVLAPPSVPECWLQACSFMENDVILICNSSQGQPTLIYSWRREQNAAPLPSDSFVEDQHTGSLMLHNLSDALIAGTYTCKAFNELDQAECSVTLRVTYAAANDGVFMGITLIVLLFEVMVMYIILHGKGRSTSRKHAKEAGENQFSTSSAERWEPTTVSVQY
ncbi:V-set and immunoglobulin domain-containing protein 2-like isoform X2 [Onychostoma macrolepis]|uniref:V-set and immunoglobulin domain-containing protein 2-like isoform X2 n=1 Tax=Onychostoma macrolepis TaxID=369639 RepID=UPI00272CBF64|nr:V-set and immunoglobulin domain-containing protein 2-like isoform X2 [Onychostoma macrolepis]